MRVDRLQIECAMYGGGYVVGICAWDGVKGRLTHIAHYDKLSYTEMCDVVYSSMDVYRPGTEFTPSGGQNWVQAPLFD